MLTKEQIQKEIEGMNVWIPVSEIEKRLDMPPTTLQKVLKGTRSLPKKWHKKLEAYFVLNSTPITENNEVFKYPLTKEECFENLTKDAKEEIETVKIADLPKYAENAAEKMKRLIEEQRQKIRNNKK